VLRSTEVYPEFSDLFFLEFACLVRLLPNRFSFMPIMLGRGVRRKKNKLLRAWCAAFLSSTRGLLGRGARMKSFMPDMLPFFFRPRFSPRLSCWAVRYTRHFDNAGVPR